MLSIGKLGAGPTAADYYLRRQAGCEADYYTGSGERGGVWCGSGSRALGLAGSLTVEGERTLRALLAGETVDGERLVAPVLRADPRSRVPAAEVVAAVHTHLAGSGRDFVDVVTDDRLSRAFERAVRAVERAQRRAVWPAPSLPADVAGRVLEAVGLDPATVLRSAGGRNRFAAAMRRLSSRVDVRLSGLDFTLSAPKSVTLLWALGSTEVSSAVRDAHSAAVSAAVEYMESACAVGLRGHHGRGHRYVETDGLIGVAFEHRTSREDDPQLHTHVAVANLLHGVDGKWGALNTREAFRHARTGGFVYQAVLRGELTDRLGVRWGPVRKGQADVDGIPKGLLSLFSKRRAAINAQLDLFGRDDASAARAATLATRSDKSSTEATTLRERWRQQARDAGYDPVDLDAALHRQDVAPQVDVAEVTESVLAPEGLTQRRSTFDRRDVMRAVCEAVPAGAKVTLTRLRELATAVVRDANTVPLLPDAVAAERRYSTAELLQVETRARADAVRRLDDGLAVVDERQLRAVSLGSLSREQAAMVRRVTTSGAGVEVVVGPAGAGKTVALAAARAAWERAGVPVAGAAVAAIAARVLEDGAGIRASSLARLLADVQRVDPATGAAVGLPEGGVLVVDEAGMVGTRTLAELIELTETYRTKLVLVGDPHQLPEIEAGGLFGDLVQLLPAATLAGNRRQRARWERAALAQLRDGDVLAAVTAYSRHDRVRFADGVDDLTATLVGDYVRMRAEVGAGDVLVVSSSRADARRLNRVLRDALVDAGELGVQELLVAVGDNGSTRAFRVGEQVVVTANDYRRALLNGTRGQVTAVDVDRREVTVRVGDGRDVHLDERYLRSGRLAHGYALTCHKAQGMTVEVAMLWGSSALTRETGYVAMSRGRAANYVYATWDGLRRDFSSDVDRPRVEAAPTARQRAALTRAALVDRLDASGRQRLARSWWRPRRDAAAPAAGATAAGRTAMRA